MDSAVVTLVFELVAEWLLSKMDPNCILNIIIIILIYLNMVL